MSRRHRIETLKILRKNSDKFKLSGWTREIAEDRVKLTFLIPHAMVPKYSITIEKSFDYQLFVFGWRLPSDHDIFTTHHLTEVTVSVLVSQISSFQLCPGLPGIIDENVIRHLVPYEQLGEDSNPFKSTEFMRVKNCFVLLDSDKNCLRCSSHVSKMKKNTAKKEKNMNRPLERNTPLSTAHPNRLKLSVQELRAKNKELERINSELESKSVAVDSSLATDITTIMESTPEMSPFMKLFWEQQKLASKKKWMQYHPMIIRFCLSIASKSASAYDELRDSGVLRLPSRRTLRDYRNAITPQTGYNPDVIDELRKQTSNFKEHQKFVCISFDEMKIQEGLVFNKFSNELVGFVDLGDPDKNFASFDDLETIAKYAFVFYVRGIASDLKFALAYFGTAGMPAFSIMSLFWEAVSYLELSCELSVVACVSDGASTNRKFYKMHKVDGDELTFRAKNPFAEERYVFFFADAPHLMKTLRNCVYSSGFGKKRLMWNDGKEIIWTHIFRLAQDELDRGIKLAPKITMNHVELSPYSKMNVSLAAQVMSKTVANILFHYYPKETHGTAELCEKMNKFFDCTNVRNQKEAVKSRNPNVAPYKSTDDSRFEWLDDFLDYLKNWSDSVKNRPGKFTKNERKAMFLSRATYEGLQITAKSTIELTKFLLENGVQFVLTERFSQDVIEEYFGRHRMLGRRNDNPTLQQFGYQDNTIRLQRSIVPVTGNTSGKYSNKRLPSWTVVDDTPLNKRLKTDK